MKFVQDNCNNAVVKKVQYGLVVTALEKVNTVTDVDNSLNVPDQVMAIYIV